MTARSFTFQVAAAAGAPGWFIDQPEKTWVSFETGPKDITGQPTYGGLYLSDSPVGNLFSYSGGCVHERNQSLLVHGGGHNAGTDNGIYEFCLIDENSQAGAPRWRTFKVRGAPALPSGHQSVSSEEMWNPEYYFDRYYSPHDADIHPSGSPRSSHVYSFWVYVPSLDGNPANDAVWFPATGGGERPVENCPDWLRSDQNVNGFWKVQNDHWNCMWRDARYGQYPGPYSNPFSCQGPSVYVGVNPKVPPHILNLKQGSAEWHTIIDVATGIPRAATEAPKVQGVNTQAPASIMDGEGIVAWCDISTQTLVLINVADYAQTPNNGKYVIPRTVGTPWPTGTWQKEHALVWHSPSNGFLAWGEADTATGTLWKLHQPDRDWWNGAWLWTAIAPVGGDTPTAPNLGYRTYRRFNIIRNVGGSGRDAIVLINDLAGPTFVYKLPSGGLS